MSAAGTFAMATSPLAAAPRGRRIGWALAAVAVAGVAAYALGLYGYGGAAAPSAPPFGGAPALREPTLAAGEAAPPLRAVDFRTGAAVRLEDYRGRPTVLVFGSFGCDVFCHQLDAVVRLHDAYQGRAAFVLVYVTEAPHALPELGALAVGGPTTGPAEAVRRQRIAKGLEVFHVPFPCALDEDGQTELAYRAFPQRLVLLGADGRVVYDTGGGTGQWNLGEVRGKLRAALSGAPLN
jgi:hypothetical protein